MRSSTALQLRDRSTPADVALSRLYLALPIAAVAVLLISLPISGGRHFSHSSVWSGSIGVALAGLAAAIYTAAKADAGGESRLFAIGFPAIGAVYYGLASLAWVTSTKTSSLILQQLDLNFLSVAMGIAGLGLFGWAAGFSIRSFVGVDQALTWLVRRMLPGHRTHGVPQVRAVVAVYLVGVSARVVTLLAGRYSYIDNNVAATVTEGSGALAILGSLQLFASVGLVLAAMRAFASDQRGRVGLLLAFTASEFFFGLLSGMRSQVVLLLASIGVVFFLLRGRPPMRMVLFFLLTFTIVVPFTSSYRLAVRTGNTTRVTTSEAIALVPRTLGSAFTGFSLNELLTTPRDFVLERFRGIDYLSIVVQKTPTEIPYVPIEQTLTQPVLGLIPRAIWPGKPVYTTGLQFARDYLQQDVSIYSSNTPTQFGDLYRRGGVIAVFVGMLFLGAICRALSRTVNVRSDPRLIALAIPLFLTVVNFESDMLLLPIALVQTALYAALATWLAYRIR